MSYLEEKVNELEKELDKIKELKELKEDGQFKDLFVIGGEAKIIEAKQILQNALNRFKNTEKYFEIAKKEINEGINKLAKIQTELEERKKRIAKKGV